MTSEDTSHELLKAYFHVHRHLEKFRIPGTHWPNLPFLHGYLPKHALWWCLIKEELTFTPAIVLWPTTDQIIFQHCFTCPENHHCHTSVSWSTLGTVTCPHHIADFSYPADFSPRMRVMQCILDYVHSQRSNTFQNWLISLCFSRAQPLLTAQYLQW